ncbi:MATE family efflux transporter [Quadrisphaera sp. GCM10027208]|uniref:MATE family efflux transporter n=1 Tax=Quadrisphaera sp. GCM10027208 TaxID=3273423 RepID=UPI003608DB94
MPAFGALVAEPLFLLADSAIIGYLGTAPLAGLGVAGAALATAVGLFVFLAYATTGAVARRFGAGDLRAALAQGVDGMWLAAGLGVPTALAGWVWAPEIVAALGASTAAAPHAEAYLRWSLPGLPAMLVVLAATGVLRGLQDTRTPLVVAATGAGANVVLNVVLVHGLGLGIAGSAIGTVLAQLGMATALAVVVVRGARRHDVPLAPRRRGVAAAGRSGLPLVVRTLTLRVALLVTTAVAARQGDTALAAHQVVSTLWTFLAFALDAVAIAGQAITGRALGAGDVAQARGATRRMLQWGVTSGVVLGTLLLATSPVLPALFTPDPAVRSAVTAALVVAALAQPVAGWVFVLDGVLIGAGDGRYLAVAGVLTLVAYLPLAGLVLLAAPGGTTGLVWLWVAFGLGFMLARAVTLGLRARGDAWLVTGAAR